MKRVRPGVSLHFAVVEDGHVERGHHGLEALVAVADSVGAGDFGGAAVNDRGERLGRLGDPRDDAGAALQAAEEVRDEPARDERLSHGRTAAYSTLVARRAVRRPKTGPRSGCESSANRISKSKSAPARESRCSARQLTTSSSTTGSSEAATR